MLLHAGDAPEVALELVALAGELQTLFLDHLLGLARRDHAVEVVELRDPGVHRLEVGEHAAQPAVVHVRHAATVGLTLDRLLGLLLGPHEEHGSVALDGLADEPVGGVDPLQRLLEIDDVDPIPLAEDESAHLGVPTARLVAEVDAGLQQLFHGDDSHSASFFRLFLRPAHQPSETADTSRCGRVRSRGRQAVPESEGSVLGTAWATPRRSAGGRGGSTAQGRRARTIPEVP